MLSARREKRQTASPTAIEAPKRGQDFRQAQEWPHFLFTRANAHCERGTAKDVFVVAILLLRGSPEEREQAIWRRPSQKTTKTGKTCLRVCLDSRGNEKQWFFPFPRDKTSYSKAELGWIHGLIIVFDLE